MSTAVDIVLIAFNGLADDEQQQAFVRISEILLQRQAGEEGEHETSGAVVQPLEIVEDQYERSLGGEGAESGVQLAQHTSAFGVAGGAVIEEAKKSRRNGVEGARFRASLQR